MMNCDQQDYIEIACSFRLSVRLTLRNGEQLDGVAVDTLYNAQRQECVQLGTASGKRAVPLDSLKSMQALTENPHFRLLEFD
ncbi:MAG: Rho-binding antiterminator [Marinobacter sp.]|uniref:Rho-binding antiterminator n=1 Tax=Marinobacter sp. TaxID=50741 RepID=UPI00299E17AE|nr:Rho-binding antiterminator [Marinobacter sp.]MDX1757399.1 Rho-binding antiterminator [Marinobacter sp.]